MRRFYNFPEYEPRAFDETDVYQIPFLIDREAILGEVDLILSDDEVGELSCESMG